MRGGGRGNTFVTPDKSVYAVKQVCTCRLSIHVCGKFLRPFVYLKDLGISSHSSARRLVILTSSFMEGWHVAQSQR